MAFEPPTDYNSTVMVNKTFQFVSPTVEELTAANPILTYNSNIAQASAATAQTAATNAAQSATTAQQAAAQAVEITDPEGWRTDTRAMIAHLALAKSDSGTLYFSGGLASATPNLAFDTLSVLFKTDFDFATPTTALTFTPFRLGVTTEGEFFSVRYGTATYGSLGVYKEATTIGTFARSKITAAMHTDGKFNAFAFVFKKLTDGNAKVSLFVNGTSISNAATATAKYPTLNNFIQLNQWASTHLTGTLRYSDFRVLNFDVSATDAPYSLADYQAGKRLPPSLTGVQLALGNYTIARNTTTKLIKDASGNGNDATVSGDVAGDMDAGIAAFVDELKTQISQQSSTITE